MNLWKRLDLIEEVNYTYCDNQEVFGMGILSPLESLFYLAKVNICLFFAWEKENIDNSDSNLVMGLAYINKNEHHGWYAPTGAVDWEEVCTGWGINNWYFCIYENSNW